jgi:hypothetical protein
MNSPLVLHRPAIKTGVQAMSLAVLGSLPSR